MAWNPRDLHVALRNWIASSARSSLQEPRILLDRSPEFRDLRRGGRYATAGAIAGPLVELDVRTLYLKDLTLFGCTFQQDEVFENLVSYIERGEIRPLVAKTFPLSEIRQAQTEFLAKAFTGKLVLVPPE